MAAQFEPLLTFEEVLNTFAEQEIGALVVYGTEQVDRIFLERDIVR
jgi:hypothetical protein